MTFLGLMKGGDRSVGSEENLIRPGKTYYFRVRGGGANDEAKWSEWISATPAPGLPSAIEGNCWPAPPG